LKAEAAVLSIESRIIQLQLRVESGVFEESESQVVLAPHLPDAPSHLGLQFRQIVGGEVGRV